jgi:outer membrane protein assembly factor BamB
MTATKFVLLIGAILTMFGCRKNAAKVENDAPVGAEKPLPKERVVWQTPLSPDSGVTSQRALTFDDRYLYTYTSGANNYYNKIDKRTGASIWRVKSDDYYYPVGRGAMFLYKDILVAITPHYLILMNASTGTRIKKIEPPSNWLIGANTLTQKGSLIANALYLGFYTSNFRDTVSHLIRLNLDTESWQDVVNLSYVDTNRPLMFAGAPASYINPQGDSILLFDLKYQVDRSTPYNNKCVFYAYNITLQKTHWVANPFDYFSDSDPAIMGHDTCYVTGLTGLYAINANDGSFFWVDRRYHMLVFTAPLVAYKDKLALLTSDGGFFAVAKKNGERIYRNADLNYVDLNNPQSAIELNGVLYCYGGGFINGIDLETGKLRMRYYTPSQKPRSAFLGFGGIAADAATNQIFVEDQYFLYAVKAVR